MVLNKRNLAEIKSRGIVQVPDSGIFNLPEKVLQFGTGVLLRGLPEYFIDKANKAGIFNGRVVIVKSTGKGTVTDFDKQDCLYTIGIRGVEDGYKTEENIICAAVSRVLNAQTAWNEILKCARSEDLEIIISNTTEVGIQLSDDDIQSCPPLSFPGKLLAVLYERFIHFDGDQRMGLVIIPTELISENGSVLKQIIFELAAQNNLDQNFIAWLGSANTFCNSLVDRIVPGKPDEDTMKALEEQLGYRDELLIIGEKYSLWAIEGDEKVEKVLSFGKTDSSLIVSSDISRFRELKLRLLNGSHTLTCAIAILAGFETVHQAMENKCFSEFIKSLLYEELSPAIPFPIGSEEALEFSDNVLDRFRNTFIRHHWISISTNYTLKLKMRVVPLILHHYEKFSSLPEHIAFGFAAFILFMRSKKQDNCFYCNFQEKTYKIDDAQVSYYFNLWSTEKAENVVMQILSNTKLWGADLSILAGFAASVKEHLLTIEKIGVLDGMKEINLRGISFNETK